MFREALSTEKVKDGVNKLTKIVNELEEEDKVEELEENYLT